ncbi:MAG TPA: hypothetical protein PK684_07440 [Bacillota bacterium]|jgi:hypothetical protein|nr:hypothetical protein [Bacillota bacterium]
MMDNRNEKKIKDLLSGGLGGLMISGQSKRRIKDNMTEILARRRLPLWKRLIISMREFWHSTYEISLMPAALTGAAAVALVLLAVHPGFVPIDKPLKGETVYVQSVIQQNGTQTVVYVPIGMEVINDANN